MARTSTKQEEILRYINHFITQHGYAPSVREIGAAVNLRSTASVSYHMSQLREKGLIAFDSGKKRALSSLSPKGSQIPIVGVVTAGMPILAVENQEGYLSWDGDESCFALRVRGDSMINAGILDGDLVVVRPQKAADDGQTVVAMIDDEATVKTLRRKNGKVWLQPENPAYPIIEADHIELIGLVKAVVRYF